MVVVVGIVAALDSFRYRAGDYCWHCGVHKMTTEEAIRLYNQGSTITELSARMDLSYFGVRHRLVKAGIKLRTAGRKSDKPIVRKVTVPHTEPATKWDKNMSSHFLSRPMEKMYD